MNEMILLPEPRQVEHLDGHVVLPADALIVISDDALLFEAQLVQRALEQDASLSLPIVAGSKYNAAKVILAVDFSLKHSQGYQLTMRDGQVFVAGADYAGVFYGVCTLRQIIQQYGATLPALNIVDWPDYPARGVMLDISRDKVPTMATLYALIDRLASWKINEVQLYTEHTFAYQNHPDVWALASPMTGQEILELDAFCRQRHIDLVPNQNSLGHMERWLKHDRYFPLAETPDGFEFPWGGHSAPTTLNPIDPASIALVTSLFEELLPHFTSTMFNVGGDEPWEFGQGKSKAEVDARGKGRVYLDFLHKLYEQVTARGRQMQFWGDIIIHYPDLVPELPHDIIAMEWGYEATDPFDEHCALFAKHNVPFYVVPGTSSWNTLAGRTANSMENLRSAAVNGLKHGSIGFLNTDWGDRGHWQPLPVSELPFAYGAGISWAYETNHDLNMPRVLDQFAFEDRAGIMGKIAYDLGKVYLAPGLARHNGSALFDILQRPAVELRELAAANTDLKPAILHDVLAQIDTIMQPLKSTAMQREDAALIRAEFTQVADLLRHACHRGLWMFGESDLPAKKLLADIERLLPQQRANWLARNRRGGLEDSMSRFGHLPQEYSEA